MDSRIAQNTGVRVQIQQSSQRQTPKTDFGSVMSTGLSKTADAVMSAGQLAAPHIPGGAILSAAITNLGALKQSAGGQSSSSAPNSHGLIPTGGSSAGASGTSGNSSKQLENMAARGDSQAVMMLETKKMQEMNMGFNLQYLQLQQNMQQDNRQFTLLSNIMKTKHDTAKNAIGNVR